MGTAPEPLAAVSVPLQHQGTAEVSSLGEHHCTASPRGKREIENARGKGLYLTRTRLMVTR